MRNRLRHTCTAASLRKSSSSCLLFVSNKRRGILARCANIRETLLFRAGRDPMTTMLHLQDRVPNAVCENWRD